MNDVLLSDRVIVFNKGKVVSSGTPQSVFKEKDKLNKCGVEVPFMIEFSLKLMDKDIIKHVYLDMGKLVDAIWK